MVAVIRQFFMRIKTTSFKTVLGLEDLIDDSILMLETRGCLLGILKLFYENMKEAYNVTTDENDRVKFLNILSLVNGARRCIKRELLNITERKLQNELLQEQQQMAQLQQWVDSPREDLSPTDKQDIRAIQNWLDGKDDKPLRTNRKKLPQVPLRKKRTPPPVPFLPDIETSFF